MHGGLCTQGCVCVCTLQRSVCMHVCMCAWLDASTLSSPSTLVTSLAGFQCLVRLDSCLEADPLANVSFVGVSWCEFTSVGTCSGFPLSTKKGSLCQLRQFDETVVSSGPSRNVLCPGDGTEERMAERLLQACRSVGPPVVIA